MQFKSQKGCKQKIFALQKRTDTTQLRMNFSKPSHILYLNPFYSTAISPNLFFQSTIFHLIPPLMCHVVSFPLFFFLVEFPKQFCYAGFNIYLCTGTLIPSQHWLRRRALTDSYIAKYLLYHFDESIFSYNPIQPMYLLKGGDFKNGDSLLERPVCFHFISLFRQLWGFEVGKLPVLVFHSWTALSYVWS